MASGLVDGDGRLPIDDLSLEEGNTKLPVAMPILANASGLHRLTAEDIQVICSFLIPPAPLECLFDDPQAWKRATSWDTEGKCTPLPDTQSTLRDIRALACVNSILAKKCRPELRHNVRVVSQVMLEYLVTEQESNALYRYLHLLPTVSFLSAASQMSLLEGIQPGQLGSISLSLLPFLMADTVHMGYHPSLDIHSALVERVIQLNVTDLCVHTNIYGLSPSLAKVTGLTSFRLDDDGFMDMGDDSEHAETIASQHAVISSLLASSKDTLETIIYRRKDNDRSEDYSYIDFGALLMSTDLHFPKLAEVDIRRTTIDTDKLKTFLEGHNTLSTFQFFPLVKIQLPGLPNSILHIHTNCHLPPGDDSIPRNLVTLCIRGDGRILPPPTMDHIPALPTTLKKLHARLPPRVQLAQLVGLLGPLHDLEELELLVTPFPWMECECPAVRDVVASKVPYEEAWAGHAEVVGDSLGWRTELNLPRLVQMFSTFKNLRLLSFNHDQRLAYFPFPDIHHNGRTATNRYIPAWWLANVEAYRKEATFLLKNLDELRTIQWRVCEGEREAWIIWEQTSTGDIDGRLSVAQDS